MGVPSFTVCSGLRQCLGVRPSTVKSKSSGQTGQVCHLQLEILLWMEIQTMWVPSAWEQQGNRIDCFLFLSGNEKLLLIIHLKSNNSTKFFLLCTLIMALAQFQTSYLSFKAVDSLITAQKQKLSLSFETFRVNLIVPFLRHL